MIVRLNDLRFIAFSCDLFGQVSLISYLTFTMDDSGDDLFITQSTFRTEVDTQDASEAVDYFDTSIDFLHNDTDAPEVVQYWDFSDEVCNAESVVDKPVEGRPEQVTETPLSIDANVIVGQEPIISLENKLDDAEVDAVSDEVVSAALQAVLGNAKDLNRCGDPVTDTDVSLNTAKGYVFPKFFLSQKLPSIVSNFVP